VTTQDSLRPRKGPRRSPSPSERQRDPERTRERILEAALAEFGAKGYAGARVNQIAQRAGVNGQLISYYFGGKEGVYREVARRWRVTQTDIVGGDRSLGDVVAGYAGTTRTHPDVARMLLWQGLAEDEQPTTDQPTSTSGAVDDLRKRQRNGEIAPDLDPPYLLLALIAAASAPVALPHVARDLCGLDPQSAEFGERYADQLRHIVAHLSTVTAPT
jgi:TetR/AcrR family transcriptional regulator